MKQILKTAIPLSLGFIARESEWGVLVVFASAMGSAEVWTILRVQPTGMEQACVWLESSCTSLVGGRGLDLDHCGQWRRGAGGWI